MHIGGPDFDKALMVALLGIMTALGIVTLLEHVLSQCTMLHGLEL